MIRERTNRLRRCLECNGLATHVESARPYEGARRRLTVLYALPRNYDKELERVELEQLIHDARFYCADHGSNPA